MKVLFLLLMCFSLTSLRAEASSPANAHLLRVTKLKEFKMEKATLNEALDQLREKTRKEDQLVNFIVSPDVDAEQKILTLDLRGISGMDAFATILQLTNTRAELRRNIIWILPNP